MGTLRLLSSAVIAVTMAACGGGRGDDLASAGVATSATALAANQAPAGRAVIVKLPASTVVVVGTTVQLVAQVTDKSGKTISDLLLAWSSADVTVATVSSSGLLAPLRPGSTAVTASANGTSAATAVSVVAAPSTTTRSGYVGTNLSGIAYYATQFPFADMMKSGMGWVSREDSGIWGAPFPALTPDSYPAALNSGQHAVSAVAWNNSHYPSGRYVILWDGDGTISFPMSSVTVANTAANRIAIDVPQTTGALWVSIDRTSATNPVRNLRFLWPGSEATYATQPFNTEFLKKVTPFSILRFKDWGSIDGSPVANWTDRSKVSDVTYAGANGVPVEIMIDLANRLHVDPWFSIPHQATDNYIRQFAAMLHTRLDPTLRPHIEYSNEVWNGGFSQTTWAIGESNRLGLPLSFGTPSAFYAQRSVEMFKIIQQVYGVADSARLVRVLAGQAAWTQFLENALAWKDTALNADVLAIAPYFHADSADDVANVDRTLALTSDQILDQMLISIRGNVKTRLVANASLAARYKLKMKAYEAGPEGSTYYFPVDKIDAMTALLASAHRNPRMRDLYVEYLDLWIANGGDTMNQFNDIGPWSKWGMWGSLEYVTQDPAAAPKYKGLLDSIAAHPSTR